MPLADATITLPGDLLVKGLTGGTATWERAQAAWELGLTLDEFEAKPEKSQNWALAVWRTKRKVDNVQALVAYRRRKQ